MSNVSDSDPTVVVPGVVVLGAVTVIAGLGDSGKTSIVADLAFHVAQRYPTVYIAADDAPGINLRRRAWMAHWNTTIPSFGILADRSGVPCAVQLLDDTQVEDLITTLRVAQPKLVVIDTLNQCAMGADEHGTDMTGLVGACSRIAHTIGCAVIGVYHTPNDGTHDRAYSTLKDTAYGVFEVAKDDSTFTLSMVRVKNTSGEYSRRFTPLTVTLGMDVQGNPMTSTVLIPTNMFPHRGDTITPVERAILDILTTLDAASTATYTKLKTMAVTDLNISERSVTRTIRDLFAQGYITAIPTLRLTEKGQHVSRTADPIAPAARSLGGVAWDINPNLVSDVFPRADSIN